ncbi:MAG: SDR family oxidoreductase [Phreatobacter sp.]|uniref:SDR family oxidoreductase n=1 Tax=Phreatobacter sp. TaxID=1966341 RepID=UPI001A554A11|nr:SDR family oxidoreductase [Phreatobacter sp.]MBL8571892.1 SDR family oxidoreductase [Phreatobacter sp.]
MARLRDKVAIVTGASSGIGRAAAIRFAAEGARIVAVARGREGLDRLAGEVVASGGEIAVLAGSVADEAVAEEAVAIARERFGGLDIAFNNAGALGEMGPAATVSLAGWQDAIDVNLTGSFLCARHQVPAMMERGGGSILFTSSFVGHTVGFPGMAAYAASKAGLIGLMQVLAAEYGPQKIRANVLIVGGTDTPMGRQVISTPEMRAFVEGLYPLKRLAEPDEIAEAALFLASDASSFVTGAALPVEGGVSINRT